MTNPKVWTERELSGIGWTDCTWCSLLMVVVGSGFTAFPLGAYTEAERKAFRGGDPELHFSGGVENAKARYGVSIISPAPYSQAGLLAALNIPGRVYAVAGKLANFPAGHTLRRWAPNFIYFHAVAVVTYGGGKGTWLDPLAPMGYEGDTVNVADVANIFAAGNYPNDARYLPMEEDMDSSFETIVNRKALTIAGAESRIGPTLAAELVHKAPTASEISPILGRVDGEWVGGNPDWLVYWNPPHSRFEYVHSFSWVSALVPIENPPDPAVPVPPVVPPEPTPVPPTPANILEARAALVAADLALIRAQASNTTSRARIGSAKLEVTKARTKLGA